MPRTGRESLPPVIGLGSALTGLATVRGMARGRMEICAAARDKQDPTTASRLGRSVASPSDRDDSVTVEGLAKLCGQLGGKPVVMPSRDAEAFWLARNAGGLRAVCRFSSTQLGDLLDIVSKDGLYAIAQGPGLPVVPALSEPTLEELVVWSLENPAPYLLKPFWADGKPITMAPHRWIRQGPANFGTTSFGEIPALGDEAIEAKLFDYTTRLLEGLRYHGSFGMEWLQDRDTGKPYLIDFNPRPFSSVDHLTDRGLNLQLLAYREVIGEGLANQPSRPELRHLYWMDFTSDFCGRLAVGSTDCYASARTLAPCRSFAVSAWDDPAPRVQRTAKVVSRHVRGTARRCASRLIASRPTVVGHADRRVPFPVDRSIVAAAVVNFDPRTPRQAASGLSREPAERSHADP